MTASYSGDANYLPATSGSSDVLDVAGPITVSGGGSVTISDPGQSGTTTITVTPNDGFYGSVTLSCSAPAGALETSCGFGAGTNFTPTLQVTANGSAATATFNVTTTASHQISSLSSWEGNGLVYAVLLGLFAPVMYRRRGIFLTLLAAALLFSQTACGGGGGNASGSGGGSTNTDPGTAPGVYSFTVKAQSGSGATAYSTSTPVSVLVQ